MMKTVRILCFCLCALLPVAASADDKIDPAEYICAELLAAPAITTLEPSLFEVLQVDGYVGAELGKPDADPNRMLPLMALVLEGCALKPADKVIVMWKAGREAFPDAPDSPWKADTTTCADYSADEENGSGFVIWLDGYNRKKNTEAASVLENDEVLQSYLEECSRRPKDLMLTVMEERTKKK